MDIMYEWADLGPIMAILIIVNPDLMLLFSLSLFVTITFYRAKIGTISVTVKQWLINL